MWTRGWIVGVLVGLSSACAMGGSYDLSSDRAWEGSAPAEPLEGYFAICAGAYAQVESLIVREGEFEHFIQSHGIYGGRSSGTYEVVGDTLVMTVTEVGPAPEGVVQPLTLERDFVVGEYAGMPVLWRSREAEAQALLEPGTFSQYAALFYGGPERAGSSVPTCREAQDRLAGEEHG
jgi:hypothetical protein